MKINWTLLMMFCFAVTFLSAQNNVFFEKNTSDEENVLRTEQWQFYSSRLENSLIAFQNCKNNTLAFDAKDKFKYIFLLTKESGFNAEIECLAVNAIGLQPSIFDTSKKVRYSNSNVIRDKIECRKNSQIFTYPINVYDNQTVDDVSLFNKLAKDSKKGWFLLRPELTPLPGLSVGYERNFDNLFFGQLFLNTGLGVFEGETSSIDIDPHISLGGRYQFLSHSKFGIGFEIMYGSYYKPFYLDKGIISLGMALSIKNLEFVLGVLFESDFYLRGLRIGTSYNLFRPKKIWDNLKQIKWRELTQINYDWRKIDYPARQASSDDFTCIHDYGWTKSRRELEKLISEQNDGIVGIYESALRSGSELAVIKQNNGYQIIYLSGETNNCWEFGHLKAKLRATATTGLFKATWYKRDFIEDNNCIISFDGLKMKVLSFYSGESIYLKMYPNDIQIQNMPNNNTPKEWSGSGFALGNGYIVTNNHVVEGATTLKVKGVKGDLNTSYSARIVSTDKHNDIAIIKIDDDSFIGFGRIPYGVSSRIGDVGEDVYVLGYPLTQALGNEIKLTNGIISSHSGFQGDLSTYQISAPVTHGNSGGPMFDVKGNVIGIVNSGITYKNVAENVGYAIKISYLKNLIESEGLNIKLPSNNTISTLPLTEKIKKLKDFVFYIECSN